MRRCLRRAPRRPRRKRAGRAGASMSPRAATGQLLTAMLAAATGARSRCWPRPGACPCRAASGLAAYACSARALAACVCAGCAVIALLYVLEAALLGDEPWLDLAALAAAPAAHCMESAITPLVLRQTRKRAEWARTTPGGAAP